MTLFIVAGSWLLASFVLGSLLGMLFQTYDEWDPPLAGAGVWMEESCRLGGEPPKSVASKTAPIRAAAASDLAGRAKS